MIKNKNIDSSMVGGAAQEWHGEKIRLTIVDQNGNPVDRIRDSVIQAKKNLPQIPRVRRLMGLPVDSKPTKSETADVKKNDEPQESGEVKGGIGRADLGNAIVTAVQAGSEPVEKIEYDNKSEIGSLTIYVKKRRGKPKRKAKAPIKLRFEKYLLCVASDKPDSISYRTVGGAYMWLSPHVPVEGRPIIRSEWVKTGIGVRTIEMLNGMGVWTVEQLALKEVHDPGWINRLSGISDKEYASIKERINELLKT